MELEVKERLLAPKLRDYICMLDSAQNFVLKSILLEFG